MPGGGDVPGVVPEAAVRDSFGGVIQGIPESDQWGGMRANVENRDAE